ncbi:MAG: S9 family peptidase, partial [Flavobacteriales bacterium]
MKPLNMKNAIACIAIFCSFQGMLAQEKQEDGKKDITLEDIWEKRTFRSDYLRGMRSMKDGLYYTNLEMDREGQAIVKYAYKTGKKVSVIVDGADLIPKNEKRPIGIEAYSFSADETKVMINTETERIYRHSTREKNYIYDLKTKNLTSLAEGKKQRYATFSPTGSMLAYVRDNNLFVKDLNHDKEIQITSDGEHNKIINGATDWVYEEEFSFDKAFFWSPDGNKIAFYKFDESAVREFNMQMFGELYPEDYRFKYPKAGEDNSQVSIFIYNLQTGKMTAADLGHDYEYIPRIKWTQDANTLSVIRMNRHQNKLELLLVNATTGQAKTIMTENSDTYIDITDNLTFLKDKLHYIWTSEKDGFSHIYLFDINGKQLRQITSGNWDVTAFYGINEKSGTIYYQSSETSPLKRDVYSIKMNGTGKKKISEENGWNNAEFSNGYKYYVLHYSNANMPERITLHNASGKLIRTLIDNAKLNKTLAQFNMPRKEFFTFQTSEGMKLHGWMIKPPDFDESKSYPLLMYVYGGPGIQTVTDHWSSGNFIWHSMLAQKGFVIASIDNRGTGARGRDFKNCTYKQLGHFELEDQIEGARYLGSLPYIDRSRIG